jgi:hypothetical protein
MREIKAPKGKLFMKNKNILNRRLLKHIALGSFLIGSFAGTISQSYGTEAMSSVADQRQEAPWYKVVSGDLEKFEEWYRDASDAEVRAIDSQVGTILQGALFREAANPSQPISKQLARDHRVNVNFMGKFTEGTALHTAIGCDPEIVLILLNRSDINVTLDASVDASKIDTPYECCMVYIKERQDDGDDQLIIWRSIAQTLNSMEQKQRLEQGECLRSLQEKIKTLETEKKECSVSLRKKTIDLDAGKRVWDSKFRLQEKEISELKEELSALKEKLQSKAELLLQMK